MNQNAQTNNSPMGACPNPTPVDVLIVDDEEHALSALKRRLGKPWSIHCATSADEGMAILEKHPCAIVISDLHMPAKDGIEFFTDLHQKHPDTIRIMLTGDVDRTSIIRAVNQGHIFRFLNKPCPPESVEIALRDGIEIYRARQSLDHIHAVSEADLCHSSTANKNTACSNPVQSAQADTSDATCPSAEIGICRGSSTKSETNRVSPANTDRLAPLLDVIAGAHASVDFTCDPDLDYRAMPFAVVGRILGSLTAHARDLTHGQGRLRVRISSISPQTSYGRLHPATVNVRHLALEISNLDWRPSPETVRAKYNRLLHQRTSVVTECDELDRVAHLVEEHQGWIQIQSGSDRRTVVRVYLPEARSSAIPNSFQP